MLPELWAVVGVGVILLAVLLVYASRKRRKSYLKKCAACRRMVLFVPGDADKGQNTGAFYPEAHSPDGAKLGLTNCCSGCDQPDMEQFLEFQKRRNGKAA